MAWHPVRSLTISTEPVTLAEAKQHCRVSFDDDDAMLGGIIAAARAHVERYCNARFAVQSIERQCDGWDDFARLADAPVSSVSAIGYVGADGEDETLDEGVYRLEKDGYEPSISLVDGQSWPDIRAGTRITLTGVFGGECPPDVKLAILGLVDVHYNQRDEPSVSGLPVIDALLANHRRGV